MSAPRRATIIGLGLIGGSIGMALRQRGWTVSGHDLDPQRVQRSLELGAIDASGIDPDSEVTFVATPVMAVAAAAREALARTRGFVTDVGSVKASIVSEVDDPRFVGGHPMAGSEQEGVEGSDPTIFQGAVWVLTPTATTDDAAFATLAALVASLGAEVVALDPERHDALVAVVSHVPHLAAASLMTMANERAEEHAALLRLAAGGFRDMTRIASGHPGIWLDICADNRAAIVDTLDHLIDTLGAVRKIVDDADREGLRTVLTEARAARVNLPGRISQAADMAEVRVPVPDRAGVLAEVTTLAAELGVNIADIEVTHAAEGTRGVLVLIVEAALVERFKGGLLARGYRPSSRPLE